MIVCPKCGTAAPEGQSYCAGCGCQLPESAPRVIVPPPPPDGEWRTMPPPPEPPPSEPTSELPPPPAPAPPFGQAPGAPPNYLVPAIVITVLCCVPLGIPAIVYANQVNTKWAAGDHEGARHASRQARMWLIFAAIAGAVVTFAAVVLTILGELANR